MILTAKGFGVGAGQVAVEFCYARGWTDGLPVVPPTEDRVLRMLAATGRAPAETVAWVPARRGLVDGTMPRSIGYGWRRCGASFGLRYSVELLRRT